MNYTYTLRRGSKKELCPACGKRSFTPYVNNSGEVLDVSVGRCDRQQKCCYHYPPHDYFSDNKNLNRGFFKSVSYNENRCKMNLDMTIPQKKVSFNDFKASMRAYDRNSLIVFLFDKFKKKLPAEEFFNIVYKMRVGTSSKFGGSPIFWLIDSRGNIKDGKIMGYNPSTGKRIKKPYAQITNVHSILNGKNAERIQRCWMGEHQLWYADKNDPIWIFESEKAALIASLTLKTISCAGIVCLATGGCSAFNPTSSNLADSNHPIQVIKNRDIVLFPDVGKYDEWTEKSARLYRFARSASVCDVMENPFYVDNIECEILDGDGFDDIILRYIDAGIPLTKLKQALTFSRIF